MRFTTTRYKAPLLGAGLLAIVLALFASGCQSSDTGRRSSAQATATPIVINGVSLIHVTDKTFGYQLDIPRGLQFFQDQLPPGLSGDDNRWLNEPGGRANSLDGILEVDYWSITAGLEANQCPQSNPDPYAVKVTVGPGITGYETNTINAAPPPQNGGYGAPSISVSFLVGGVAITIGLSGSTPRDTFMQRYGPIWRHMLASFIPGKYVNPHPICQG